MLLINIMNSYNALLQKIQKRKTESYATIPRRIHMQASQEC